METNYRSVAGGELCDIIVGNGLTIEMFRSFFYTGNREGLSGYMPASVRKGNKPVWSWKSLGAPKGQFGELLEYGDEPNSEFVIVIRDKRRLYDVYRVNDFVHSVMVKLQEKTVCAGASTSKDLLQIKLDIAESEALFYSMKPEEWLLKAELDREKRNQEAAATKARRQVLDEAKRQQEAAAEEARQLAKRKHDEKVTQICARSKVHAFTYDGQHRIGTPVYDDEEWKCLPDGKWCVLMKDEEPVEAFIVSKQNAKVKKIKQTAVTGKKPEPGKVSVESGPQAIGEKKITIRGESRRVLLFKTMGDVRALREAGLNSGTWVGVQKEGSTKIDVYAMNHGDIATVGVVQA